MHAENSDHQKEAPGFYSKSEVCALTSLSMTTIWRLARQGAFPPSVRLSANRVGFQRAAVDRWIQERLGTASNPTIQKTSQRSL